MSDQSGTHERLSSQESVEISSERSFGLVFTVVFLIVSLYPLLSGMPMRLWAAVVAGIFLTLALFRPEALAVPNLIWARFGLLLNKIVSPLILGLVFFLVFVPTGYAMRLAGKDLLNLKLDKTKKSYWIERTPAGPSRESMTNQF